MGCFSYFSDKKICVITVKESGTKAFLYSSTCVTGSLSTIPELTFGKTKYYKSRSKVYYIYDKSLKIQFSTYIRPGKNLF